MEIYTDKVKLNLTTEEAKILIEDKTFEILIGAVLSLDVSLGVVNDFSVVHEEVIQKVRKEVKRHHPEAEYNLIDKLYNNLVLSSDSTENDLTQGG